MASNINTINTVVAYDLKMLDEQPDAIQDPNYLMFTVHYKNGSTKGSYNVPFNSIGNYFSGANQMTAGTVKLATATDAIINEELILPNSPLANHAISFALGDNRYIQARYAEEGQNRVLEDATSQAGKVIKTNADGLLSASFFSPKLMGLISGLGRYQDTSIITSGELDTSWIQALFMTAKNPNGEMLTKNSRCGDCYYFSKNLGSESQFVDAEINTVERFKGLHKDADKLSLALDLHSSVSGLLNFSSNLTSEFLDTCPKNNVSFDEYVDLNASFMLGYNVLNSGKLNVLSGYNLVVLSGQGIFGTGIMNKTSDHFSFITGIKNHSYTSYGNFTTGTSNNLKCVSESFISGHLNTLNSVTSVLSLSDASKSDKVRRTILLGEGYTVSNSSDSIVALKNAGSSKETDTSIVVRDSIRSILLGQCKGYSNIQNSIIANESSAGANNTFSVVKCSLILTASSGNSDPIRRSVLIGSDLTSDGLTSEKVDKHLAEHSIISGVDSQVIGLDGAIVSIKTGSKVIDSDNSIITGSSINVSSTVLSSIIGQSLTVERSNYSSVLGNNSTVRNSSTSLIAGYECSVTNANQVMISGSGLTLNEASSSIVTSSGSSTVQNVSSTVASISGSGSDISSIERSFISAADGCNMDTVMSSLVLSRGVSVSTVKYSLLSLEAGSGEVKADISGISCSVILGSIPKSEGTEIQSVTDSLILGQGNQMYSVDNLIMATDNSEYWRTYHALLIGQNINTKDVSGGAVIGSNNSIEGNGLSKEHNTLGNLSQAYVFGLKNTITNTGQQNETTHIFTSGKENNIKGVFEDLTVFGFKNEVSASEIWSKHLFVAGHDNFINAVDCDNIRGNGKRWDGFYCIGNNNKITYTAESNSSQRSSNLYALGSDLLVNPKYTGFTQYFGCYNEDPATDPVLKTDKLFKCSWGNHSADITALWGMGSSNSNRLTGMYLGILGNNCADNKEALLYVKGTIKAHKMIWTESGSQAADYAERFLVYNQLPMKRFVTVMDNHAVLASGRSEYILGVTSENPAFVGDMDLPANESAVVGLLGKLAVTDYGNCLDAEYCKVGEEGIALPSWDSTDKVRYRILKRLDPGTILILFR